MGKKSQKRKFDELSSSSSTCDANKKVKYNELPEVQMKTWVLCDELNILDEYFKLLDWMFDWGCSEGFDFDGLKTLRCVKGYPLIELEIVYQQNSKKLLISRASLYILAFYSCLRSWRKFKDTELNIDFGGNAKLMDVRANYQEEPWKTLGLKSMIDAFTMMDCPNELTASKGCMVFAVHLCEACRIKLIRLRIAQSMMPCVSTASDMTFFQGEGAMLGSESCRDVLPSLRPIIVDLDSVVAGDDQVEGFIKMFKQLCKAWMVYVLSRNKFCPLEERIANKCGVKYLRTLRHSLSLLSNTNLSKIVDEWVKKFDKGLCPANFERDDLNIMRSKVLQLQNYDVQGNS